MLVAAGESSAFEQPYEIHMCLDSAILILRKLAGNPAIISFKSILEDTLRQPLISKPALIASLTQEGTVMVDLMTECCQDGKHLP